MKYILIIIASTTILGCEAQNSILKEKVSIAYTETYMGPQYEDQDNQTLPWYTKPFLEVLLTWDISDWDIFEWGSGNSTVWYALHAKSVTSIEYHPKWKKNIDEILKSKNLTNACVKVRQTEPYAPLYLSEGGYNTPYVLAIEEDEKKYDCIIIDGMHRNACAIHCLKHLKPGGIIILDNANQTNLGIDSRPTFNLLNKYKHYSFQQSNSGKLAQWRTDYWIIG